MIADLDNLLEIIDQCNRGGGAELRYRLYSGRNWWTICEDDYEWGDPHARASWITRSRKLSEMEAIQLYITVENTKRLVASDMEDLFKEKKNFILDHYSPEELEEHAKKIRTSFRIEERKQLEKNKAKILKEQKELEKKIELLNKQLDSL